MVKPAPSVVVAASVVSGAAALEPLAEVSGAAAVELLVPWTDATEARTSRRSAAAVAAREEGAMVGRCCGEGTERK